MDRRTAIKNLSIAAAGTLLWTGCKESYVNALSQYQNGQLILDAKHLDYLDRISDTFLPLKDLKDGMDRPADFILRMVNNLQSPERILQFTRGFEAFKNLMKGAQLKIKDSDPKVVLGIVKDLLADNPPLDDLLSFINAVRGYSIWNLKSSEHYMTEYSEYAMVPPSFEGNATV